MNGTISTCPAYNEIPYSLHITSLLCLGQNKTPKMFLWESVSQGSVSVLTPIFFAFQGHAPGNQIARTAAFLCHNLPHLVMAVWALKGSLNKWCKKASYYYTHSCIRKHLDIYIWKTHAIILLSPNIKPQMFFDITKKKCMQHKKK